MKPNKHTPASSKEMFTNGQIRKGYRIDGGAESDYTYDKEQAINIFESVVEDFGEAAIWELIEQYDIEEKEWDIIEENMIRSSDNYHSGFNN